MSSRHRRHHRIRFIQRTRPVWRKATNFFTLRHPPNSWRIIAVMPANPRRPLFEFFNNQNYVTLWVNEKFSNVTYRSIKVITLAVLRSTVITLPCIGGESLLSLYEVVKMSKLLRICSWRRYGRIIEPPLQSDHVLQPLSGQFLHPIMNKSWISIILLSPIHILLA